MTKILTWWGSLCILHKWDKWKVSGSHQYRQCSRCQYLDGRYVG